MRAKLHTPVKPPRAGHLLLRILLLVLIIVVTVGILQIEGGLVDNQTGEPPSILDTLYFTMVTITTVGYGDIVPVSTFSRMVDTFFLTPMRFIVFVLFVGIAYDLAFKRFQESFLMHRSVNKLNEHTIVCGYGETGRVVVEELLTAGADPDQIVVLEKGEVALDDAAKLGVVPMLGDASKERVLQSVAIERARHILICPGRDDTTVLIALTARDLNPNAHLAAMCHEIENIKLIERSGVDTIVAPAGGNLIAAATRRPHLVDTMKDLLQVGGTAFLNERLVKAEEVGKHPRDLSGIAVVRVYRKGAHYNVSKLPELEAGDVLVFVASVDENPNLKQNHTPSAPV